MPSLKRPSRRTNRLRFRHSRPRPWSHVVEKGQTLRIIDLEGNQAVDCILYNAHDPAERYSSCETIVAQRTSSSPPARS